MHNWTSNLIQPCDEINNLSSRKMGRLGRDLELETEQHNVSGHLMKCCNKFTFIVETIKRVSRQAEAIWLPASATFKEGLAVH